MLSFTSFDREGNKFRYLISNFKILDQVPDQTFEFDENKYPDVEIVDLR
ncbi:MAG: hypothetical protein MI784_14475 [Cytophagales bacterium]|nr:hypothetical protein [Cytophagales bacterium]